MEYLKCDNLERQRASNVFLYVSVTEFFALDTKEGRKNAVYNLLGLVNFWESEARQ